jgi:hypothetical protein
MVEAITSSQVGNREFIPGKGKDSSRYDLDSTKYAWALFMNLCWKPTKRILV